ncbi:MAG TPA: hypothetical protein VM733_18485 [Thermoanaerobaculia bacterium]|nr:hypothetical protein [Thermoanaerobaculia bacterium]
MRSSSVKTLVTAVSLVATLVLTTPAAHAAATAPAPARDAIASRESPRGIEKVGKIVRRVLIRLGISTNELPVPPLP